ncbi:MAG: sigma-E factor negative regulatory protein [Thiofilum sp.]|uniref:sigma-E factor negative regulatory protein n=1 Tax=Thiofilum sp. TaxID=2212733 RepID=UPI0025DC08B9|nr:sigma-E factor negative regulatory protein [Thiofilum sp.]MBK8455234.1 sigma-E factor negative regulatory protein [Thiofilum sp.]
MNVTKYELLSALLDDEAGDFERRRLLNELKQDDELVATWRRYALTGEVLRKSHAPVQKRDFLAGIHAAIDDEIATPNIVPTPIVTEANLAKVTPMWRTVMQYGAAASLGAVIMAAGLMFNNAANTPNPVAEVAVSAPVTPVVVQAVAFNTAELPVAPSAKTARSISRLDPKTQALLRSYIKDHIRYASTTSVVPTVRAVSYNQ